jgi:voltage-gated potassium channel
MLVVGRWRVRLGSRWLVALLLVAVLVVVIAAAAAAAVEGRTVSTYARGIWWAVSLVTTVGFIGEPPDTSRGAVLSAGLMIFGFFLLATVSASLAALFVREEELPREEREESVTRAVLASLQSIEQRLDRLERAVLREPDDRSGTVGAGGRSAEGSVDDAAEATGTTGSQPERTPNADG